MPSIRNIIIFVVIAGVIIFLYVTYFQSSPEDDANLVSFPSTGDSFPSDGSAVGEVPPLDTEFLPLLLSVENIKLDATIFEDPAFKTLQDSSIILIQDQPEGRPNPFAPIGFESTTFPSAPVEAPILIPGAVQ